MNSPVYIRFYLAQTYIEHGKFLPLDEELEEEEKQSEKLKVEKANARIKKEVATALAIERRKKKSEKLVLFYLTVYFIEIILFAVFEKFPLTNVVFIVILR